MSLINLAFLKHLNCITLKTLKLSPAFYAIYCILIVGRVDPCQVTDRALRFLLLNKNTPINPPAATIATARTRKRVVSGIALEVDWTTSVDDTIGEAIDVATKIADEDVDEDNVADEIDVEIKLDEVVEINWDDEIEEIEVARAYWN